MQRLPESMSSADTGAVRLRLLEGKECLEAEQLWREVFDEDTERFTEYYFSQKAAKNRGLVLEGAEGIRSMLYLTPERMMAGGCEVASAYIVGVATKEQYRHRGYMAALLKAAFGMLHGERMPFVFLMPASPDIYTPFDFTWIYDRPVWDAASLKKERLVRMEMQDIGRMTEFAQDLMQKEKSVYVFRDSAYYKQQMEELAAQEGYILGYEEGPSALPVWEKRADSEKNGLKGLCMYTAEAGREEILEVLADSEAESAFVSRKPKREPSIMARIIHAEKMLSMMTGEGRHEFSIEISDPLIEENNGVFFCRVSEGGTKVEHLGCAPDVKMDIAGLTAALFGYRKPGNRIFDGIRPFSPVWINEIV